MSPLSSRQAVLYTNSEVGQENCRHRVTIYVFLEADFRCLAVDAARAVVLWNLQAL